MSNPHSVDTSSIQDPHSVDTPSTWPISTLADFLAYRAHPASKDPRCVPAYYADPEEIQREFVAHCAGQSRTSLENFKLWPVPSPERAVRTLANMAARIHKCQCQSPVRLQLAKRPSGTVLVCRACDATYSYRVATPFHGSPLDPVRCIQFVRALSMGVTPEQAGAHLGIPLVTARRLAAKVRATRKPANSTEPPCPTTAPSQSTCSTRPQPS